MKKILITGGTGFIGTPLVKKVIKKYPDHIIEVLTRNKSLANDSENNLHYINDINNLNSLDNYSIVINLGGEPIANKRWTKKQKGKILSSRINITERLVNLMTRSENPPDVFISGSAVGYYGNQSNKEVTEDLLPKDTNSFAVKVCSLWEKEALKADNKTRVCLLRTSNVLGLEGGMIKKILPIYKLNLGGVIGDGKQYMSWIHIDDMVSAIIFLIENKKATGAFNLCTEYPVTNNEFNFLLLSALKRKSFIRTPEFLIKPILGEMSSLILDSIRGKPKKLKDLGFSFRYKKIDTAFNGLLGNDTDQY